MTRWIKKTIELCRNYVDMVGAILGLSRDQEAVNKALEPALIDETIIQAHEQAGAKGNWIDEVFK